MPNPTIVSASLDDKELQQSIANLVAHVKRGLHTMLTDTNSTVDAMEKKLKSLGNLKIDSGGSADGGASKRAKAQNAETVAVKESTQAYKEKTLTFDQGQAAMNTAIQSEKKYTDEILRQAAAIRATEEWKKTGRYWIGDTQIIDPSVYRGTKKEREAMGTLEEQLLRIQKSQTEEIERQAKEEKKLAEAVAQTAKTVSYKRDLQMSLAGFGVKYTQDVTNEQVKQYQTLEEQLKKLKASYASMNEEAKKSEQGIGLSKSITDLQKQRTDLLNSIKSQLSEGRKTTVPDQFASLRQSIANVLGVQKENISLLDIEKTSSERLAKELKMLQLAYSKLSASRIAKGDGTDIANEIQRVQRSLQKLQATQTRPTSLKSVMGLDEKTLDDMAYKLRQLQSYKMGLNVKTQVNEMKEVDKEIVNLKKRYDELMGKNQQMIASNTALGRSWNYMKNRLAFYFTVSAGTSFVKQLIDIRGQYELLERSIGILIDSAQNGSQIFAELNAMAIKSPFTTMELGAAAKQLVAYDVSAKDVVDTTRRLADMAAAVGIPIERLTYALGQIKAYGYLNARDARMFANAGIPLVKELADYYTELEGRLVSTADVYDRIKKKAIDYNDVMSVVNKMTDEGGKFFDFQEKAADTLKVRIANLALAWNNMLNEMGKDNQGILTEGLKVTKQIFESWRDINNMVIALGWTYGSIKAAQIAYYLWVMRTEKAVGAWSKIINAIDYVFNAKIANLINSLKTSLVGFFTNPAAMLSVAFTALSVALTKAYLDYRDLQAANEEFNKSVVKNAEENVKSIDKFFGDYKKQLESVGSLNSADQTKLWERVQEEIEKTTKNAEKYIEILNKIPEISKRIEMGEEVLEQSKRIQDELKNMAERGMFNIGGGFANDSAAKDLQQYSDTVNELIAKYGDLDNAKKESLKVNEITLENGEKIRQYTGEYADFQRTQIEAEKELQNIISTLDKVNIAEVLGTGNMETQLANVRSFAIAWRDAFLATEKGSKISAEGQALLNSYVDKWIEQQARANHLIKDENTAAIEANRTAWETFFKFLNTEERKRLDVAIKTNQLGSKSVQELWDNAAERMQEKATTSYNLIQQQIADLRNTPDIVINVVYRNNKEKLEKDQEEFEKKFIQPKDWGVLSTDEYLEQEKANREKYGTLMRKQGEDTAEYEKRISDERKKNLELSEKNGKVIEENKNKTSEYSVAVTKLADKEKKAADDRLKVIKEVEDAGGYDFSTKSERAAANKAAKQAETELQKALKDELSTIDKVRSIYKDLTKEGMSHANAVERATRGWDETVNAINRVLQKNGLQKLDLSKFAGIENPRELVNMLQSQLNTLLKRGVKPAEIKELQTKIQTLNVDAEKYDLTKITKGLNNELGKLKDEYELAVELDANPELGGVFMDMIGISEEQLKDLPRDFEGVITKLQSIVDSKLGVGRFSLEKNLSKAALDAWLEANKQGTPEDDALAKSLNAIREYANKVRLDETKKQIESWDKLLEKYAEYEYKKEQIRKQYEKELATANKKGAGKDIIDAITNRYNQENAKLDFEKFQKSPEWITATGNLAGMTNDALRMLIRSLEQYKDSAKNLDPKQVEKINKTIRSMYKQIRGNNPFMVIANAMDEAASRADAFEPKIQDIKNELELLRDAANIEIETNGFISDKTSKKITKLNNRLAELKTRQEQVSHVSFKDVNDQIGTYLSNAQSIVSVLKEIAATTNDVNLSRAAEIASDIVGNFEAAQKGAESWGGWWGAIIGGGTDLIGKIFKWSSRDADIESSLKHSELAVKNLEAAYVELEHAVNNAYGTASIGANKIAIESKKLQLTEMKRQLQLEQSRSSKQSDDAKIADLKREIKELEYEIIESTDNIVNELLGISSVGDAMETLMDGFVEALRSGEDAMAVFDESVDDMIANMVKKMFTTKILQPWFEEQWGQIQEEINKRGGDLPAQLAAAQAARARLEQLSDEDYAGWVSANKDKLGYWIDRYMAETGKVITGWNPSGLAEFTQWYKKAELENAKEIEATIEKQLNTVRMVTSDDIRRYAELLRSGQPVLEDSMQEVASFLKELGLMKDDANKNLSALQQGIQGITEDTAGALEAYMNGVSQQVYLHSDLLTQIRDAVVGMDMDIQVATQAQMLLQLQQSYAVQMAIQGILEGVLNPSGRAFSVELVS